MGVLAARWSMRIHLDGIAGPTHLSPIAFGVAGALASLVLLVPSRLARAVMLFACVCLGFAAARAQLAEPPPDHLSRLVAGMTPSDAPPLIRVRGVVVSDPSTDDAEPGTLDEKLMRFDEPAISFELDAETLVLADGSRSATGTLRVLTEGLDEGDLRVGDHIEALGMFRGPASPMNRGQADGRLWSRQRGDAGTLRASTGTITRLEPRSGLDGVRSQAIRTASSVRRRARTMIDTDEPGADAVRAMLVGERAASGRTTSAYARTGTAHLLAISGFHLSVLAMLTVGLVRVTGDRPRAEAFVGLAFLGAYLLIVPANTPIVRAALLASAMLASRAFARRWDHLTVLGWVALLLVLARPMDLTTLGFQLTMGLTALLVWMAADRHPWTAGRTMRFTLDASLGRPVTRRAIAVEFVRAHAVTALVAWLVSAPVILYHTGSFNPLTPVAVITTTPIASLIQVVGLAGLSVSMISDPIGGFLLDASLMLGRALAWVAGVFDSAGTHRVAPPVSAAWSIAAACGVLWLVARARLRDWRPWAGLAAVVLWFGVEVHESGSLDRGVAARVDMLAVGDGSCLLVRAGDDAVLWDAGSLRPRLGVRTIPSSLRELGSPRVRTALITHANVDHYGALPDAAVAIGLRRVLVSAPALAEMRASHAESAELMFLAQMDRLGVVVEPIAKGETLRLGDATLRVLWPSETPPVSIRAANDRSLVARLEVPTESGERRVLLVGDIQRSAMLMLLAGDGPPGDAGRGVGLLDADVMELAHHGSHHAVAEAFVEAVGPSAVLQSTGRGRLGDRRWNRVKRDLGAWWGITSRDGALWAEIRDDGSVETGSVNAGPIRAEPLRAD